MNKDEIWYSVEIVYKDEALTSIAVFGSKSFAIDFADKLSVRARVYPFACSDGIISESVYDNNNSNFAF